MNDYKLLHGDCLDKLKELEDNSIDAVVTDPPYGLSFMGKKWDYDVPKQEIWEECMRVLKPGGHLLAFAGSRTYHRMAIRVEDAGFEIRDQIMWLYGSGFPKSHNIGKAVEKVNGTAKVIGKKKGAGTTGNSYVSNNEDYIDGDKGVYKKEYDEIEINNEWEGWGTALKPAHEPIVMARKPFKGSVANNVLEHGVGGLNIDGCRVEYEDTPNPATNPKYRLEGGYKTPEKGQESEGAVSFSSSNNDINPSGRFPANIIIECTCENPSSAPAPKSGHWPDTKTKGFGEFGGGENTYNGVGPKEEGTMVVHTDPTCPCYILDQQSGTTKSNKRSPKNNKKTEGTLTYTPPQALYTGQNTHADEGGASRFFYCPKVSKKERNEGVEGKAKSTAFLSPDSRMDKDNYERVSPGMERFKTQPKVNFHPTVKPSALMEYLIRLVTPKGGIVLDPFMGSGSTGKACAREGMKFVGVEMDDEYIEIAKQRVEYEYDKRKFF